MMNSKRPRRNKLLMLSLFRSYLPEGGIDAFLDSTDSLWKAFDRYGSANHLDTIQVFTIFRGLQHTGGVSKRKDHTVFHFFKHQPIRNFLRLFSFLPSTAVVLLNNESYLNFFAGLAFKLSGARVAVFLHNAKHPMDSKLPRPILRFFRNNIADAFLTNSLGMKRLFKPYLQHPVFLFSFGVDPLSFKARKRTPRKDLRVLYVGRISPEKRIEEIIEGIRKSRHRDRIEFMIVGQDQTPGQHYWEELVQRMTKDHIRYHPYGFVPHSRLLTLYREADIFANLRPDEGFGKVFIEAMAAGLPVVAKKGSPGPESIIRHGDNGFLIDSHKQFADLIETLMKRESVRTRTGAAARQYVQKHHSFEHSFSSLSRALDPLIAGSVVENEFYQSRPFETLRRMKRVILNQRVDTCNHVLAEGAALHLEQYVLSPYCKGKGIDVGCGSNKTHPDAIGVDLTARGRPGLYGNQRGEISVADIQASGDDLKMFRNGELDYVVARHNLEHYKDPARTLREWKRVVRAGGIIGIVIPDNTFIDTMRLDPTHYHAFTPESFRNLVEKVGRLTILRLEPCVEDWSFLCVMRKVR